MAKLTILINYGGKWVNSLYKGGKVKALVVSDNVTYEEIRDRLYGLIGVDPNEYGITMKAVYCGKSLTYPVEIVDNDDVTAFICESLARDWKIPLCITLERRVFASESGSNHCTQLGLATQVTKFHSLDPHAELEEQNSVASNSGPVPMDINSGTQENLDCGVGLFPDVLENDKQHGNLEVDVEHNNLRCDDVPQENLQFDDVPDVNLQFDSVSHDHLQFDNVPHENMQFDDVPLNPSNSDPQRTRYSCKLTEKLVNTILNVDGDIALGSLYESKKDLQKKLGLTAMKNNFEFRVKKSTKDRFEVGCVNDNCTWRLRATKSQDFKYFRIRLYNSCHSCSLDAIHHDHRQASSSLIGQYIKLKYKGVSCQYKPKDIIEDMRKDLGVNISYGKAWRARECALEDVMGSPKESPATRQSCGRRKKERIQSHGEEQSTRKCGRCGATGHNRQTCKNRITLHLNSESECATRTET